jgi:uncharacterized membrane protein YkvA (DUF1232 family)
MAHIALAYAFQPADLIPLVYVVYRWLKEGTQDL